MSEIRVTSVVGENGGDRVGLTTGLTVGPLTGTTGIGATITHQGHAQFAGVCTATEYRGGGNSGLKISSEGYVTKPNTPAFQVAKTNGDVSSNNYVIFNQVYYNNGSHYNTSNGRFTAPVTGIYHFYAWHFTGGTSQFRIDLNGSSWQGANTLWDDVGGHASWTMPMTSGQYVQIYTQSYAWRGTANFHNAFGGYLIG